MRSLIFSSPRFLKLLVAFGGSLVFDWLWKYRSSADVRKAFGNIDKPHRKWVVDTVSGLIEFDSLCEVGSGYGPNLELFARKFPKASFLGVDISPASIEEGSQRFRKLGIGNVLLHQASASKISIAKDKSFDVVLTDACLLYCDAARFEETLRELARISKSYLVLVELNDSTLDLEQRITSHGFVRNYQKHLAALFPEAKVTFHYPPAATWVPGPWPDLGCLILVELCP